MSSNFGEFIPIWDLPPLVVGLFILGLDFGVVMAIRIRVEGKRYFTRWWTFKVGDTIGLPVYAGFAAAVLADHEFSGIYTEWWWHLVIFLGGYALWDQMERSDLNSGFKTRADLDVPSERYHTFVFRPMFYMMASIFVPLIVAAEWNVSTILAFAGLAVYIGCFVIDQTSLVDRSKPFSYDRKGGSLEDLR